MKTTSGMIAALVTMGIDGADLGLLLSSWGPCTY